MTNAPESEQRKALFLLSGDEQWLQISTPLEEAILKAAQEGSDDLDALLQEACEQLDEDVANGLLDKVEQIMREKVYDARKWRIDEHGQ
jgi:hypothetical protein